MRQASAIFLVFSIAFQAFYNAGVTAFWLANRAEIAVTRCENRDKPDLHCEGKCFLKKKIAESPDTAPAQEKSKLPNFKKGIELADWLPHAPILQKSTAATQQPNRVFEYTRCLDFLVAKSIFHPPSA